MYDKNMYDEKEIEDSLSFCESLRNGHNGRKLDFTMDDDFLSKIDEMFKKDSLTENEDKVNKENVSEEIKKQEELIHSKPERKSVTHEESFQNEPVHKSVHSEERLHTEPVQKSAIREKSSSMNDDDDDSPFLKTPRDHSVKYDELDFNFPTQKVQKHSAPIRIKLDSDERKEPTPPMQNPVHKLWHEPIRVKLEPDPVPQPKEKEAPVPQPKEKEEPKPQPKEKEAPKPKPDAEAIHRFLEAQRKKIREEHHLDQPVSKPAEQVIKEKPVSKPAEQVIKEKPVSKPAEQVKKEKPVSKPAEQVKKEKPVSKPAEQAIKEQLESKTVEQISKKLKESFLDEEQAILKTAEEAKKAVLLEEQEAKQKAEEERKQAEKEKELEQKKKEAEEKAAKSKKAKAKKAAVRAGKFAKKELVHIKQKVLKKKNAEQDVEGVAESNLESQSDQQDIDAKKDNLKKFLEEKGTHLKDKAQTIVGNIEQNIEEKRKESQSEYYVVTSKDDSDTTNTDHIESAEQTATEPASSEMAEEESWEAAAPVKIEFNEKELPFREKLTRFCVGFMACVLFAYCAAFIITHCVASSATVEGQSMEPTLREGENLIVESFSYRFSKPKRYDIVSFPVDMGHGTKTTYYIKRVIGLPGETVQIINNGDSNGTGDCKVYINNKLLASDVYSTSAMLDPGIAQNPIKLKANEYFVLGDNRNMSTDSRNAHIGIVKKSEICGKAVFCLWPFSRFGSIYKKGSTK